MAAKPPGPKASAAKLPVPVVTAVPAKTSTFEQDFDRALTGGKKTVRARMTEKLRKLAEEHPEAFAKGLKRLVNSDGE